MVGKRKSANLVAIVAGSAFVMLATPQVAHAGFFDWLFGNQPTPSAPPVHAPNDDLQTQPRRRVRVPQRPPQVPERAPEARPTAPAPVPGPQPEAGGELAEAKDALAEFRNQSRDGIRYQVTKQAWTDADEIEFGRFVAKLGKAIAARKCNTVKKCMRTPEANLYADRDPQGLVMYSDCADFPYFLRAYFAYHNGLPFGYVTDVKMNPQAYASVGNQDGLLTQRAEHNSPYGNIIVSRGGSSVPRQAGGERDLITYLENMFDQVSTRTYRVGVLTPSFEHSDLYPVKINRQGIMPGTVVHSTGHALIVWGVETNGLIRAIDAHPDGSVQFKNIQPSTLDRSRPDQGLGFYKFRPMQVVGGQRAQDGSYFGGRVVTKSDQELFAEGLWSVEQWFGPGSQIAPGSSVSADEWTRAFKKISFFDFLAKQMRDPKVSVQADSIVGEMMKSLCDQMQQRVADIDTGMRAGISQMPHPETLPADIFGEEDPNWGKYSTPGRDSRMRGAVGDIIRSAVAQFRAAKSGDRSIKFAGSAQAYVAALRARIAALNKSCLVTYTNSKGSPVTLNFSQVTARLGRMSFDPYLCPEKSWGASGAELQTCVDSDSDASWYAAQKYMRNVTGKLSAGDVPTVRSSQPITKAMLQDVSLIDQPDNADTNLGTKVPPILNLDASFSSAKFLQILKR